MRAFGDSRRRLAQGVTTVAAICLLMGVLSSRPEAAAVQDLEAACLAGDAAACNAKGDALLPKMSFHTDWAKAATFHAKACEGGNLKGCAAYGRALVQERGVPADRPRGIALLERACAGGVPAGCGFLGNAYVWGQGVEKDVDRGLAMLDKACDAGHANSCASYGYVLKQRYGPAEERAVAFDYFVRACGLEDINGCYEVGWAQWAGEGAPKNGAAALPPFKKSCDWGLQTSCQFVARIYEEGTGVPVDLAMAKVWWGKHCKDNMSQTCTRVMGRTLPPGPVMARVEAPPNPRCAELVLSAQNRVAQLEDYAERELPRMGSDPDSIARAKQDLIVEMNRACEATFPGINLAAGLSCPMEYRRAIYSSAATIGSLLKSAGSPACSIEVQMHRDRYLQ